ncbi:hypothetical protein UFOVP1304_4 [uncultured Caudovirales phage]|uniref:Uncharacterized protein n=1 Tax=uncultured Caudovirales phage TaxID=2100421 RepID=A0A6J5RI19_9CAUD|nr:hypothetical protein UFOVP1304_4 [uncultured Caudovirales phage]
MGITLTPPEMMIASQVGCMRHISAVKAGLTDKHGASPGNWQVHIDGALGEIAVAKALDRFWSGSVNTFKAADIGANIQVRTSQRHDSRLIVRHDDSDDDLFVLVTGIAPDYRVRGWISGADAKQDQWLANPHNREAAFFVPESALHPISSIT